MAFCGTCLNAAFNNEETLRLDDGDQYTVQLSYHGAMAVWLNMPNEDAIRPSFTYATYNPENGEPTYHPDVTVRVGTALAPTILPGVAITTNGECYRHAVSGS